MKYIVKNNKYMKKMFGKYIEMTDADLKKIVKKKNKVCADIIKMIENDKIKENGHILPDEILDVYKAYLYEFIKSDKLYYTVLKIDEEDYHYAVRLKFVDNNIHLVTEIFNDPINDTYHHHYKDQAEIARNIYEAHLNKEDIDIKSKTKTI